MTNLRNCYSDQKRLGTSFKKSDVAAAEMFVTKWKFFSQLDFLGVSLVLRKTRSDISSLTSSKNSAYAVDSNFNGRSQINA